MDDVLLTGGQALNGLLAGIYVAFVVAVMPALHGLPDDTFLRVMNRINVVIVNPAFLTLFLGAPVLAVTMAAVRRDPLTIAAAVAAVIAAVITISVQVPLNDALPDGATRDTYETAWVWWHWWHYLRTGATNRRVLPPVHPDDNLKHDRLRRRDRPGRGRTSPALLEP